MAIDWMIIRSFGSKEIGAVGFIENKVATVVSFYDDLDGNMDGKVVWFEKVVAAVFPVKMNNSAVVRVAMQARVDPDVMLRDPTFYNDASKMFVNFAKGLVTDGIYAVYFSRGISAVTKPIAGRISSNMVKQFVIRKGMDASVKKLYQNAVR